MDIDSGNDARNGQKGTNLFQMTNIKGKGKVFYKFREGFSNAVRKPLTIRDLL
jgi:hypothetical protein